MQPLSSVNNRSDNSKQFSFTLKFLSHYSIFVYFSDAFTFFLCLFIFSIREYSCNVSQTYLRVQRKNDCCIIFYCIFTLGNDVFLRFSQKNSKTPRPPADVIRAFGTFLFCFAKNRCAHIFSVLSPECHQPKACSRNIWPEPLQCTFKKHPRSFLLAFLS